MTKRTALYEIEKALGAHFEILTTTGPEGQKEAWEIASRFSSIKEEYAAVRRNIGLIDFSHRGKIRVKGPDSIKYLHGQVTQDIKKLPLDGACYAFVLTHQGAIVGDVNIYRTGVQELLIDTSEHCTQRVFDQLLRFAISDDVEIENITDNICHLGIQGPASLRFLLEQSQGVAADGKLQLKSVQEVSVGSIKVLVARQGGDQETGWTGEMGFDFFLEGQDAVLFCRTILDKGQPYGLEWVGSHAFDVLRLEAGIPLYGLDMNEDYLPLEVLPSEEDVRRAISTDKGCYVGQEVVARIIYRGHVNRILAGMVFTGTNEPQPGRKLFKGDKEVGKVTSSLFSPSLGKVIALGYVPSLEKAPGTQFSVGEPDCPLLAEVFPLPFYKTSHPGREEIAKVNWTRHAT